MTETVKVTVELPKLEGYVYTGEYRIAEEGEHYLYDIWEDGRGTIMRSDHKTFKNYHILKQEKTVTLPASRVEHIKDLLEEVEEEEGSTLDVLSHIALKEAIKIITEELNK